jgi:hypothetical protein
MERVTLRKAAKLRSRVANKMQEILQEVHQRRDFVSVYDKDIMAQLNERESEFTTAFARYRALSDAYSDLRALIARGNVESSVSSILAELNGIEAVLGVTRSFASRVPRMSAENIQARVDGAIERSKVAAGMVGEQLNLEALTQTTIDELKKLEIELELKVSALHDKMEELNVTQTFSIDLPDGMVTLFKMENVL